jgi:protoporphyrinogen oxidase
MAETIGLSWIPTKREARARYLWRDGEFSRWPLSFGETATFIPKVIRLLLNFSVSGPRSGETVNEWGVRTLGESATKALVNVGLQGVYASSGKSLSASLTVGSLWGKKSSRRPRLRGTISTREGIEAFPRALEQWLKTQGVSFHQGRTVNPEDLVDEASFGRKWILAVPAWEAARLLSLKAPKLSEILQELNFQDVTTVTRFFRSTDRRLHGFGALIPEEANLGVMGILVNDCLFENRTNDSTLSETWILKGQLSETQINAILKTAESVFWGTPREAIKTEFCVWPRGLPRYDLVLEKLLPQIESEALRADVFLTGNYLGRIGLAKFIERNKEWSEAL